MHGKMIICVRKRPTFNNHNDDILKCDNNNIKLFENKIKYNLDTFTNIYNFKFDIVYDENKTNQNIFDDIIQYLSSKRNFICYAYGETGSGKTHTIFGSEQENGILLLSLKYLINKYKNINISAYELYGKNFYDILNNKNILNIFEYKNDFYLVNLSTIFCDDNNLYEIYNMIQSGKRMGKSSQNNTSSRSHTIIKIYIESENRYILFVDLAGCETAQKNIVMNKKTNLETKEINKEIFSLKECIRAIKNKSNHIPFRGSKLTMILRDSFRDSYDTIMINTLSPENSNFHETYNTLLYANDIINIKKIKVSNMKNKPNISRFTESNIRSEIIQPIILNTNMNNDLINKTNYYELTSIEINLQTKIESTKDPILLETYKNALLNVLQKKIQLIK